MRDILHEEYYLLLQKEAGCMNATRKTTASREGRLVLETLQKVVTQTLEKKKRLGQYAVIWHDGKPLLTGEDAPENTEHAE